MESEVLPLTSVAVPSTVAPSRNVTVPVGTPAAGATAVIVVMGVPGGAGFGGVGVEVGVVAVGGGLTAGVTVAGVEMVKDALPLTSVAVASTVAPSRKVTVPVGTPTAGATALTVALRVTVCPSVEGLGVEVSVVLVLPGLTVWMTIAEVLAENFRFPL